jgi:broad specificity phosphatase PhoE
MSQANDAHVILVRHAETETNVAGVIDCQVPGSHLTAHGRAQAQELAASLADRAVARVLASPTHRAVDTARPVAERHGVELEVLDDLREIDFGELDGGSDDATFAAGEAVFRAWADGRPEVGFPGGENLVEVETRVQRVLDRTIPAPPGGDVVIVGHGATLRALAARLAGAGAAAVIGFLRNAGHVVLRPNGSGGWQLEQPPPGEVAGETISQLRPAGEAASR